MKKKQDRKEEKSVRITIPFPEGIYNRLKELADLEERSFTSQVIYMLKKSSKEVKK